MSNFIRGRHAPSLPAFLFPDSTEGPHQGQHVRTVTLGRALSSPSPWSLPPGTLARGVGAEETPCAASTQVLPAVRAQTGGQCSRGTGACEGPLGATAGKAGWAQPEGKGEEPELPHPTHPTSWLLRARGAPWTVLLPSHPYLGEGSPARISLSVCRAADLGLKG